MSNSREIPFGVTTKSSKPPQPSAEFGRRALELATSLGKTRQDLVRATSRDMKTLDRLVRGEGSLLYAYRVLAVLRDWGADVSTLPSLERGEPPLEDWLREWIDLGRRLHDLASEERYLVEVRRIADVIRAHELVAEGTGELPRRK